MLILKNLVSPQDITLALIEKPKNKELGRYLVEKGLLSEIDLENILSIY